MLEKITFQLLHPKSLTEFKKQTTASKVKHIANMKDRPNPTNTTAAKHNKLLARGN